MAKSVEKYLNKIANLIEESPTSVGENLIKRIEIMIKRNDHLSAICASPYLVALAVFHELFGCHNHTKHEFMPNAKVVTLPSIDLTDVISALSDVSITNLSVDSEEKQLKLDPFNKRLVYRKDLAKSFFNVTGKNESMDDWHEVVTADGSPMIIGFSNQLTSVLPSIGTNDTFVAASDSEQSSHIVQKGDICIRTDINKHLFNKTGRNDFVSDWIDVSQVFHSEAAMLSISGVHKGDEIFRTDLDKSFINITGKNESTMDWREVVYNTVSPILNPSINPNREQLGCNLSDVSMKLNLPSETGLFTPETYYSVNYDDKAILYVHSIFGEIAYGYMLSCDEDEPMSQINYEKITLRNSKEIYSNYTKLQIISGNVIDFVKSLPKNFPSDSLIVEDIPNTDFTSAVTFCEQLDSLSDEVKAVITETVNKFVLGNVVNYDHVDELAVIRRQVDALNAAFGKMDHRLELIEKPKANDNEVIDTGKRTNKLLEYLQPILTNKEIMHNAHNLTIQVDVSAFDATSEDFDEVSRRVGSIHHIQGRIYEFILKQRFSTRLD